MLTYFQSVILGALQGISELFPISSLGHSVILPSLLGWHVNQEDPLFLMFLVATHFATALVLFCFFWKDWARIFRGLWRSLAAREISMKNPDGKLGWLLIVSTIPAGLLGLLFEDQIRTHFLAAASAAIALALNGVLLYGSERLRRFRPATGTVDSDTRIAKLPWYKGLIVGTMQALALIPGFSRTGAALSGGLFTGLSHEDALRFSFLLATPIIGAAAALKLPELFATANSAAIDTSLVGAVFAALFAYLSVRFLTRYFSLERRTLTPFAIYCVAVGVVSFVLLS